MQIEAENLHNKRLPDYFITNFDRGLPLIIEPNLF